MKRNKQKNESFTQVIVRTLGKKRNLEASVGAWKDIPKKEWAEMNNIMIKAGEDINKEVMRLWE